jgi:Na+-driven multidrug efflux pump
MHHRQDLVNQAARIILIIGCVLSAVAAVPSICYSARYHSGHAAFHVVFNAVLLAALCSPFVLIYFAGRNAHRASNPVTFGAVFSLLHAYVIYATYTVRPQEFGFSGLIFVPFLEALIGIPISLLIVFLNGRRRRP